jgi:hypothetical protein
VMRCLKRTSRPFRRSQARLAASDIVTVDAAPGGKASRHTTDPSIRIVLGRRGRTRIGCGHACNHRMWARTLVSGGNAAAARVVVCGPQTAVPRNASRARSIGWI